MLSHVTLMFIFYFFQPGISVVLFLILFLTDLKSRYDEEKSFREAADQKLARFNQQLQEDKQEKERLQTELVQHTMSFCWHLHSSHWVWDIQGTL